MGRLSAGRSWALSKNHPLRVGICGIIEGTLPIGGLSASAAVIIAFLSALCKVNGITLTARELINTALVAETDYVGVSVGKLDQSCEVFSKKDHLLYLDTKDDSYELIPTSPNMRPHEIAIFFSGVERTLAGSKFNMRVDECRSAAYALKAYAGMEYSKFKDTCLREVPYEVYLQYKDKLPENFAKRAEHWYTEFQRVQAGAEAWRRGDIEEYGRLSFESWATTKPMKITVVDDGTSSNETRLSAVRDIQFAVDKLGLEDDLLVMAGDNLLDFCLTSFIRYALEKNAPCTMRYYEPSFQKLLKSGIVSVDQKDIITRMTEKVSDPASNWVSVAFYYYPKDVAKQIGQALAEGCGVDAPGSFLTWVCCRMHRQRQAGEPVGLYRHPAAGTDRCGSAAAGLRF